MKMPARARRGLLLLALALPLFGCPYGAEVPLDTAAAPLDARLLGRWRCVSGDSEEVGVIALTASRDAADRYDAAFTPCDGTGCGFRAHLTVVAGMPILNAQELKTDGTGDWSFVRYTLYRPDVVHFELANDEPFKGLPKPAAAPAIRHVFEEHMGDPALFSDWTTCVRVKPDEARSAQTSR
jgi:hypothetical protein